MKAGVQRKDTLLCSKVRLNTCLLSVTALSSSGQNDFFKKRSRLNFYEIQDLP